MDQNEDKKGGTRGIRKKRERQRKTERQRDRETDRWMDGKSRRRMISRQIV